MNKGEAVQTGFTLDTKEQTTLIPWSPRSMAGTFDGDGHTIRGVYLNTDTGNAGLFSTVTGTVMNLRLRNSYFNCTDSTAENYESPNYLYGSGSIAGSLSGTLDTVYSDAIVKHQYSYAGGLVGTVYNATTDGTANSTITNCCYAGEITAHQSVGGIVGLVVHTTATISHCLNAGKVVANNAMAGGLCGQVIAVGAGNSVMLHLIDNLNVGRAGGTVGGYHGAFIGAVRAKTSASASAAFVSSYYVKDYSDGNNSWEYIARRSSAASYTFEGVPHASQSADVNGWTEQEIMNKTQEDGTLLNLSFYANGQDSSSDGETKTCWWVAREGKIPMLESFEDLLMDVTY